MVIYILSRSFFVGIDLLIATRTSDFKMTHVSLTCDCGQIKGMNS